jgi:uncharacterized protein YjbI with pentapeptide repeats
LAQANPVRPHLSGADLSGSTLIGADLGRANLNKSFLSKAFLTGADLSGSDLSGVNFSGADLTYANLRKANLRRAQLYQANIRYTDFSGADLSEADLSQADLSRATLSEANLSRATLSEADLSGANLARADLAETVLGNVNLSDCTNLETIRHHGPSVVDTRTLQRSGSLPLVFLRGVGLPEKLIEYLPSILGQAIQHYSCFISYSSRDTDFAHRLHADLQDNGVRCWFAPEDMKIGAKIRDTIDEAIRLRDKVLLVLSAASIASDWVEDEVDKAFEEESQRSGVVLFPVRLDDAVMKTSEAWAAKLRRSRNIGDFRAWKDHDAYQTALKRVLRDLRIESAPDT